MKVLYFISGTMGVGKTTVCQCLKKQLPNSVFLDGDWCWNASPFQVTEETKTIVCNNICYILNNFIHCSAYDNIIFCWVMHQQKIIDSILEQLDLSNCKLKNISLVCNKTSLKERLIKDITAGIRTTDIIENSLSRIDLYKNLHTVKLDTSSKTLQEITTDIIKI